MLKRLWLYRYLGMMIITLLIMGFFIRHLRETVHRTAQQTILDALWRDYKRQYWGQSGRTTDQQQGATTSEGQSYTMLRAVWQNDQPVFDATWNWTNQNLRRDDKLFAWLWKNGQGVVTAQGGNNTASDADVNIAQALLMAYARWHNPDYKVQAISTIHSIWQQEVVQINGQPYLAADNLEKTANTSTIVVNPSYFAPAAFRIFAQVDPDDNWPSLVKNSYDFIQKASQQDLGFDHSANLPPDWVLVDRTTGQIEPSSATNQDSNFGFDALRVVWQSAVDEAWSNSRPAKQTLADFGYLSSVWQQQRQLAAIYDHSGQAKVDYSSYALYGGTLGYFLYNHPDQAADIANKQLKPLFNSSTGRLNKSLNYYDNNWAWFGLALYDNQLPNLASGVTL